MIFIHKESNKLSNPTKLLWSIGCCFLLISTQAPTLSALKCYCNECTDDYCVTSDHRDSTCFKSVYRVVENNTYAFVSRYGCLSGSDDSFASLQCHANYLKHTEPQSIACCYEDRCNINLPDPDERDDPRWADLAPQAPNNEPTGANNTVPLWPIVFVTILLTCLGACICGMMYKIASILFERFQSRDKRNALDSQESVCSFKVGFDDPLKDQFLSHHHNTASSSASTHTYTISDYLSQKPGSPHDFENSLASIEQSSTLPDMTSGVGARLLELRTMARVVDSGTTVPVGSGRFGRVFKGSYHCEDVAVKAFKPIDHESWQREEKILRKLNHENIVRYIASETYTVAMHETETWMFLEFCPFGSLCDFLDNHEICGPQQAVKIIYSIIKGLNYLHEDYSTGYKPPIAHRDIKSRNILMRSPEICCLADFGHAVIQVNENTLDFGGYDRLQVGTIRYMAPEILEPSETIDKTQFFTFAQADIYQFGLVLWEISHRTALDVLHPGGPHLLPYDGVVPQNPDLKDMIKIVCSDNYRPPRSPFWDRHSTMKILSSLMVECWRTNPRARMPTLGVKKKITEIYEQISPQAMYYHSNLIDSFSLTPNFKPDKDRSKSTDVTL